MRIHRSKLRDGNILPPVLNFLDTLPDEILYYLDHQLRPPKGIFNLSFDRAIKGFEDILKWLDRHEKPLFLPDGQLLLNDVEHLMDCQRELLLAMAAWLDDSYQIMKVFYPKNEKSPTTKYVKEWLKKVKHPTVKQFSGEIKAYNESLSPISNKIKHETGRLRYFVMYDKVRILHGFYLEGAGNDGSLGPHPEVHPDNTAISFNYSLKYHFSHLYLISRHLKTALNRAIRLEHKIELKPGVLDIENARLDEVASKISSLPNLFFGDEKFKNHSLVRYSKDELGSDLVVEYPSQIRIVRDVPKIAMIQTQGDGVSKSFRVPYGIKHPHIWTPPKQYVY